MALLVFLAAAAGAGVVAADLGLGRLDRRRALAQRLRVHPVPGDLLELRLLGERQLLVAFTVVSGEIDGGMVGLWAGNNSEGEYANLRLTPLK